MKRIVLLVSVLAAVLGLSVFAIAQAQRGGQDSASDESAVAGPSLTAPVASEEKPSPASQTTEPKLLPVDRHVNPLRSSRRPFGLDAVRATAAADGQPLRPAPANGSVSQDASQEKAIPSRPAVLPTRPVDPFGLRAREVGNARTSSDNALRKEAAELPGSSSRASASQRPTTNDVAPSPLKEPGAGGAAGRPDATTNRSAGAGEPALLKPGPSSINPVPRADVGRGRAAPGVDTGLADTVRRETSGTGEGTGRPGPKSAEGPQAPQITVQKTAPPEIQVGRPATFQIRLKNTGPVTAYTVELRDTVPQGTRLIGTSPQANPGVRGELVWQLGTLKPSDEVAVEVQLMPIEEGEIGSPATVSFSAEASARTIATKPHLVVKVTAPNRVLIGDEVTLAIAITNAGSGIARNVVLDERVPPGLQHATGPDLLYEVGDLKPNESRQTELKLTAVQAGPVNNVLVARADTNVKAEDRWEMEVLAPQLELGIEGPKRRFLDRESSYVISVSNPGTAPAKQVEIAAQLPPGLKFVRANNAGAYDDATRSVRWLLVELPVKETGTVEVTTLPVNIGEEKLVVRGAAERGIAAQKEHPVVIDGIAAVMFEVADTRDPVEVNGETTYEIRVLNQGSKASTNVQITATLPPDLRFVAAEGPTQHSGEGNRVVFGPLPRLAAKADTTYRVRVQGLKPGDQRVRVQLLTDEVREPITKEESTQVFLDR